MPLPHFTNLDTAKNFDEVIYKNLYEVTIVLPGVLTSLHPNASTVFLENSVSVKFPTYPALASIEQRFKYSTRKYMKMPESTSTEVGITFNLNEVVNAGGDQYRVPVFRILKDWYDLLWNNEDGSLHYKKNCIADIIVHAHDKEGHVIRRVTYHNCQLGTFTGWEEMDWSSSDAMGPFSATFTADYWEDYYY
ncbi:hypothetical protein M0Q50_03070 [bacterium]|jgi:hypothetical protein|nr:hypothetical protein [bacterium]